MSTNNLSEDKHFKIVRHQNSNKLVVFFSGTDKTDGKFDFWKVGN